MAVELYDLLKESKIFTRVMEGTVMLRKIIFAIFIITLSISIVGCQAGTVSTEEEILEVIIKDLDTDVDVRLIETIYLEESILAFYMTGNEYQAHEYGYAVFDEKDDEYEFFHTYDMYDRGMDLRSYPYNYGYFFLVNNADCNSIQLIHDGEETIIDVVEIPFLYFYEDIKNNTEYYFLNDDSERLNQ